MKTPDPRLSVSFEAEYLAVARIRIWLAYSEELLKMENILVTHGVDQKFDFFIPREYFEEQLKTQISHKKEELDKRVEELHRMIDGK